MSMLMPSFVFPSSFNFFNNKPMYKENFYNNEFEIIEEPDSFDILNEIYYEETPSNIIHNKIHINNKKGLTKNYNKLNEMNVNEMKVNEMKVNGMKVNEMKVNEMKVNEMKVNGMKVNEMKVNGMKVNEMKVNGMKVNGMKVNGMKVNGSENDVVIGIDSKNIEVSNDVNTVNDIIKINTIRNYNLKKCKKKNKNRNRHRNRNRKNRK